MEGGRKPVYITVEGHEFENLLWCEIKTDVFK
jgi:hypothetical protein